MEFEPRSDNQKNGHITWFDELWNDIDAEERTGDLTKIIGNSPVGDKTYGPYDVYIKTLMDDFNSQKIVFSRIIGDEPSFALDESGMLTNDTGYIISGKNMEYLLN